MGTAYPGPKIHYPSRRHLGRGQYPAATGVVAVVTFTGSTATITFARPVTVTGPIPLAVLGLSPISQTTISPTVVQIVFSGPLATLGYNLPAAAANVATYQGGPVAGTSGYFLPSPANTTNVVTVTNLGANEYLVTFDASVFTTFATSWQPQLLAFSPSADSGHGAWRTVTWIDHPTAPTIHVDAGAADCTIFAVLGQLSGITATLPFAAPTLTPIT
jgi:hypothetical protein